MAPASKTFLLLELRETQIELIAGGYLAATVKGFKRFLRIISCKARNECNTADFLPEHRDLIPRTLKEKTMNTKTIVNQIRTVIATAILGAAASVAAFPAAADSLDSPQITVKFADLNLSSPAGAAALYARIKSAAKEVCPQVDGRNLGRQVQMDSCVDHAIQRAVTHVNAPALSAVYSKSTGKELPMPLAAR